MSDKMREAIEDLKNLMRHYRPGASMHQRLDKIKLTMESALTQRPESELNGTVGNCCGPDNSGLYRISVFSGSPFPVGTTVYASPQPSAQVPEDLLPRVKNLLLSLGHQGEQLNPDEPPYDVGEWGIREAQELYTLLTAAPSAQVPKKIPVPEPILYGPVLDNADQIGYAEGWNSCVDAMIAPSIAEKES